MRSYEFISELKTSDAALRARYGDFDPEDKPMMPNTEIRGRAATPWSVYDAIQDVLGKNLVTDDEDELQSGMYLVWEGSRDGHFTPNDDEPGGSIEVKDLESHEAAAVAIAVHEAYHAYANHKSKGGVYRNEKIVNSLAEKWLRKHLVGPELMVALEKILGSKLHYGRDHLPASTPSDKR